jgi:lipopolysaccharide export system protein LptC
MDADPIQAEAKARPALAAAAADRRAGEMERWRQRSKRIVFYRKALPWTMLGIVLAVASWVGLRAVLSSRQLDIAGATSAIHMTNPKFYGRDNKGRSFQLTATDAVRDTKNNNIVNLHTPGMMLDSGGKQPVKVAGGSGVYREDTKVLDLTGGVLLQDGRGTEFHSAVASVDTRAGVVTGQKDVNGQGPLGRIAASSYAVHESGARVTFAGGVKTHIENR